MSTDNEHTNTMIFIHFINRNNNTVVIYLSQSCVLIRIVESSSIYECYSNLFLQLRTINLSNDIAPVNSAQSTVVEKKEIAVIIVLRWSRDF